MTLTNVSISLPDPVVEFFTKEAKERGRKTRRYVSRAAAMREVLEQHVSARTEPTSSPRQATRSGKVQ